MDLELARPFARNGKVDEDDVRRMKKALNRLGYYLSYEKTGITGIPDAAVFEALRNFQKDKGLSPTGMAKPGDETINALNKEAPLPLYRWRTMNDPLVRPSHAILEGKVRTFDQAPNPGEELNCRCWAEPVADIIEKEELAPPNIPGTNIPDHGVPEDGSKGEFNPGQAVGDENIDPRMEVKPPQAGPRMPVMDPNAVLPSWERDV